MAAPRAPSDEGDRRQDPQSAKFDLKFQPQLSAGRRHHHEGRKVLPAGKGGILLTGFRTSEDILNMMQLITAGGMRLEDPHHILDAMKRRDIEIYDYLESLQIKRRY